MIEFNGHLSGLAEKYFHKKARKFGRNILLTSMLLIFPAIIGIAIKTKSWDLIFAYCFLFVIIPLMTLIPKGKKEKNAIIPKKIFTEDGYIVCVADKYTEARLISEAKALRDFGEFYEIVFPFGKISDKFICQKNLIAKGTIREFEALFAGKIQDKRRKT